MNCEVRREKTLEERDEKMRWDDVDYAAVAERPYIQIVDHL